MVRICEILWSISIFKCILVFNILEAFSIKQLFHSWSFGYEMNMANLELCYSGREWSSKEKIHSKVDFQKLCKIKVDTNNLEPCTAAVNLPLSYVV